MGCLFGKYLRKSKYKDGSIKGKSGSGTGFKRLSETLTNRKFSWEKRSGVNIREYKFENLTDQSYFKPPGSVNGNQFIIHKCKNCKLFILDNSDSVSIDRCSDCIIFVGPTKNTIYIRNCENCKIMGASHQFRVRDCKNVDIWLFSLTKPSIESSQSIKFACFCYYYLGLTEQFNTANLNPFNNSWSDVQDFDETDKRPSISWDIMSNENSDQKLHLFLPPLGLEIYSPYIRVSSPQITSSVVNSDDYSNTKEISKISENRTSLTLPFIEESSNASSHIETIHFFNGKSNDSKLNNTITSLNGYIDHKRVEPEKGNVVNRDDEQVKRPSLKDEHNKAPRNSMVVADKEDKEVNSNSSCGAQIKRSSLNAQYLPLPLDNATLLNSISISKEKSVVLQTIGINNIKSLQIAQIKNNNSTASYYNNCQYCLIVFFWDGQNDDRAKILVKEIEKRYPECFLIQTRQLNINKNDSQNIFGSSHYEQTVEAGPAIGLEFFGENAISKCTNTLKCLVMGTPGLVFVTNNPHTADLHIQNFFGYQNSNMS
ncbi:unnamed protein product [Gordionus sp. m RMFG-2023]